MSKSHSIVNQERLHELYDYFPGTGILLSKTYGKPVGHFHKGYLRIELSNDGSIKRYKIHNLVWMYVYGNWPNPMIDHINGIKTDNRICNLREVTAKQNAENKTIYKTKSGLPRSGHKGVHWIKASNKWAASIGHNGKTYRLGLFDDKKHAFQIYCEAAKKLHTHNSVNS